MRTLYVMTDRHNGLKYVGSTSDFNRRMESYKSWQSGPKNRIFERLREIGFSGFDVQILATDSDSKILAQEQSSILSLGTIWPNGYNMTRNGQGGVGRRVKILGSSFSSLTDASEKLNIPKTTIFGRISRRAPGYAWEDV